MQININFSKRKGKMGGDINQLVSILKRMFNLIQCYSMNNGTNLDLNLVE